MIAKPLNTFLNILLLALGIAMITSLLLFSDQLERKVVANSKGIDLVVGAKGSPLQIILCNVFHIDFPSGNIKLRDTERIVNHPLIKAAIPLSLGDSYDKFRIVGTTRAYADLYNSELESGKWFEHEMDAVVGANVASIAGLKISSEFSSSHGLTEGGHHHEKEFVVVGVLKKNNNVLDDLILTPLESVWEVHEAHEERDEDEDHAGKHQETDHEEIIGSNKEHYTLAPTVEKSDTTREITSILLQYRSPMGALQLPRFINSETNLQSASPAFESARLFSILGIGVDVLMGFGYVMVIIAGLSIFIALYNSLRERQYDLAIMRTLGASRLKLFSVLVLEGCTLTALGTLIGLGLGHIVLVVFGSVVEKNGGIGGWEFSVMEVYILLTSIGLGCVCSLLPAIKAYRVDIHKILATG